MLYTDGTTEATKEEVQGRLTEIDLEESVAERQASADQVQALIDADPKLAARGLTVAADELDHVCVRLTVPADTGDGPLFWKGVHAVLVDAYGAQAISADTVRVRMAKVPSHLAFISNQLPDPA